MYADRYAPRPINRGSLTLSTAIVGGLVATAMLSPTIIEHVIPDKALIGYRVAPPPPPPPTDPVKPQPRTQAKPIERIDQPIRQVEIRPDDVFVARPDPGPPPTAGAGDGGYVATTIDPPKPPPPMLRGADVDGRYLRDFQPTYPTEERRAAREGVVTLRVLIGTDGRVREVERIAAASEAFWRVTQERALGKWRFKPATRDGIPYDSWKTMTVRFRLEEG